MIEEHTFNNKSYKNNEKNDFIFVENVKTDHPCVLIKGFVEQY